MSNEIGRFDSQRKQIVCSAILTTYLVLVTGNIACGQLLYAADRTSMNLSTISTASAGVVLVGNMGVSLGSLEYRPSDGQLYGFTFGANASLYRVNPSNANATFIGSILSADVPTVGEGALVISPNGTAYATGGGSAFALRLFRINLDTAATTSVGVISGGSHDINGLAWRSDGMLVGLDRESNSLLAINPANAASAVIQTLTPIVGGVGGMAAIGDTGYFATSGPGGDFPGSNQLYSFNLFTGASSLIGSFAPTISGSGISGLALIPVPESATLCLAIAAICGLLAIRRRLK